MPTTTPVQRHRPIDALDREPYRQLEQQYPQLFGGPGIQRLSENEPVWFGNAADVDMDEMVIVTATQPDHAIGTCGLGPCIAICARGLDHQGQPVLAMNHYSGVAETPEQALASMAQAMRDEGVATPQFYLVGGVIMPREMQVGSLETEQRLLAMSGQYDIRAVRLHTSEGERDPQTGQDNAVDVVMTPNRIFFRRNQMHPYGTGN